MVLSLENILNGQDQDGVQPSRICAKRSEILRNISVPQQNLQAESASRFSVTEQNPSANRGVARPS